MPKVQSHSTSGPNKNHRRRKDYSRLCKARTDGNLKIIEQVIKSEYNINRLDKDGYSLLHLAIIHNKPKDVKMLLDIDARIPTFETRKRNPWRSAIILGRNNIVKLILQSVGYTNIRDKKGETPMHLASFLNKFHILETLIKFGAGINECNVFGNTPLHNATTNGSLNVMKLLLDYGANPNYSNHDGDTPLHLAASMGKENALKILIQYKGSVNIVNRSMHTPLHVAVISNSLDVMRILILSGAETDLYNRDGDTPLHLAANLNNFKAAEELIHFGAAIDPRNIAGETPLYKSIVRDNLKLVEILIQASKNPNSCGNQGFSPLKIALLYCKPKIVERLLQAGASINHFTRHSHSHSHLASRYCQTIFIETFKKLKLDPKIEETTCGVSTNSSLSEKDALLIQKLLKYKISLSDLLESVKIFIKYEILYLGDNSSMYKKSLFEQRCRIHPSLLHYMANCVKEVICMNDKIIHEGITFHQIVTKERNTEEIFKKPSLAQDYINHILDIQYTNALPIYRDIIASQVKRVFLRQELLKYVFYTRISSRKKIVMDCGSVSVLSAYLSNIDVLNLILAISNKKSIFFLKKAFQK